ncbi:MAG: GH109, partial [uncultured Thermomicrobiales bacterium]
MDRPVRVGVVGAGNIVQRLHLPVLRQLEGVELAALAEANPERLRECVATFGIGRGHTDYREMLDGGDLDAVLVAVPNALHGPVTIAALEAGCHVLVEKPMATSGDEAARMVGVARERERILSINLPRRFSAYYGAARALLQG